MTIDSLSACIYNSRPAPSAHDSLLVGRIGSVQPHGVMLVLTHGVDAVEHVSANVLEILGVSVADVLGRSPQDMFSELNSVDTIDEITKPGKIYFDNPYPLRANGKRFEAIAHVREGKLIIEIEPYVDAERDYLTLVNEATDALSKQRSTDGLYKSAVDMMHHVTGYDRVKLYKFVSHGHGQVVAEKHAPDSKLTNSFLNYYFAASDIPADARVILATGKTRAKPQSSSPSVPLMTRAADGSIVPSGPAIDLTDAWLRGIHECDNGYNRNLGVTSNLVFPVNIDDRVWGMFVIHNLAEKFLNYDSRVVIEQMTMMFIARLLEIEGVEARIDDRYRIGSNLAGQIEAGRRIMEQIGDSRADNSWIHRKTLESISHQLAALSPRIYDTADAVRVSQPPDKFEVDLINLMDADGVAIVRAGVRTHIRLIGSTPDALTVGGIVAQFGGRLPELVPPHYAFATEVLPDLLPMSETTRAVACGMLAVAVGDEPGHFILWFRTEQVVDATWAGKPPTSEELASPNMFRPKKSFAAYSQPLRGAARGWLEAEVRLASEFAAAISSIWRKSSERRQPFDTLRRPAEIAGGHGSGPHQSGYPDLSSRIHIGANRTGADVGSGDPSRLNAGFDYSN